MGPQASDGLAGLDIQSLDPDSLFQALTSVEKAIPEMLSCVKPILAQLSAPTPTSSDPKEATEAVERYMDLLDKIQFVLRQTVYYLSETNAQTNILAPPPVGSIPTPFASTLPHPKSRPHSPESQTQAQTQVPSSSSTSDPNPNPNPSPDPDAISGTVGERRMTNTSSTGPETGSGEVELGLYGRRIEARTLQELGDILKRWGERRRQQSNDNTDQDGQMEDIA